MQPSAWKGNSANFALTEFSEGHERSQANWRVGGLPGPTSYRRRAGSPTVAQ